jgi:predicted oxidoreductase
MKKIRVYKKAKEDFATSVNVIKKAKIIDVDLLLLKRPNLLMLKENKK